MNGDVEPACGGHGRCGFVRSHAVENYAEQGADVTGLENLSRVDTLETADESRNTAAYNWEYIADQYSEVEYLGDICDEELLEDVGDGHDAVIHTAGQVTITASIYNPRTDFEVNALGTFNVLETARKADSNLGGGAGVNELSVQRQRQRHLRSRGGDSVLVRRP